MTESFKDFQKLFFSGAKSTMGALMFHGSNYQIMLDLERNQPCYKSGCGDFLAYYQGSYLVLSSGSEKEEQEKEFLQTLIDMFKELGFTGVKLREELFVAKAKSTMYSYTASGTVTFNKRYKFHVIDQVPPINWGIVYKFFYYWLRGLHSIGQLEAVYQTYKVYKDTKDAYKAVLMFGIFNTASFSTKFKRDSMVGTGFPDFALKINSRNFIKELRDANRNIQRRMSSSTATWASTNLSPTTLRDRLREGDYSFFEDSKYFTEKEVECFSLIDTPDLKFMRPYSFKYSTVDLGYGRTKEVAKIAVSKDKSVREELSNIYIL